MTSADVEAEAREQGIRLKFGAMSEADFAILIGKGYRTVQGWRWAEVRKGPKPTVVGSRITYSCADIADWMNECATKTTTARKYAE